MSFANLFKIRPVTGKHWYELLCHRVLRQTHLVRKEVLEIFYQEYIKLSGLLHKVGYKNYGQQWSQLAPPWMDVMPAHCSSTLPPVFGAVSLAVRRYTKRTPRPLNLEFTIQKLNTPLVEW